MPKWIDELVERFDLPADTAAGAPKITVTGRGRVVIENHRGLLEYSDTFIEAGAGRFHVRVRGEGLLLRAMDSEVLIISGTIFGVDLD